MTRTKKTATLCTALALAACLGLAMLPVPAGALDYVDVEGEAHLTLAIATTEDRADFADKDVPVDDVDHTYAADMADETYGIEHVSADGKRDGPGTLQVDFYQVAAISPSGSYTALAPFATADVKDLLGFTAGRNEVTGDAWKRLQQAVITAAGFPEKKDKDGKPVKNENGDTVLDTDAEIAGADRKTVQLKVNGDDGTLTLENGGSDITFTDLGLYLMVPRKAATYYYEYTFSPVLIALPNIQEKDVNGVADAEWVYNIQAYLKPERALRLSEFYLLKKVEENFILDGADHADFVFNVVVDPVNRDGKELWPGWRNAVILRWKPGAEDKENTLTFPDIPVGATVHITEAETNADYTFKRIETADGQTVTDKTVSFEVLPETHANFPAGATAIYENVFTDTEQNSTSVRNTYQRAEMVGHGSGWELKERSEG